MTFYCSLRSIFFFVFSVLLLLLVMSRYSISHMIYGVAVSTVVRKKPTRKTTQFLFITPHILHVKIVFDIFAGWLRFIFCFAWILLLIAIHFTLIYIDKNSQTERERETKQRPYAHTRRALKSTRTKNIQRKKKRNLLSSFLFYRSSCYNNKENINFRNRMPIEIAGGNYRNWIL